MQLYKPREKMKKVEERERARERGKERKVSEKAICKRQKRWGKIQE